MVPPESFSIEAPHSSIDFCNGCDGGTQCESFSSKVLSCANAGPRLSARARARVTKPPSFSRQIQFIIFLPILFGLSFPTFKRRKLGSYSNHPARSVGGL